MNPRKKLIEVALPPQTIDTAAARRKPLGKAAPAAYEAKRDLAAELMQSVREMKAGHVRVVTSPVIEARKKAGLPSRSSRH